MEFYKGVPTLIKKHCSEFGAEHSLMTMAGQSLLCPQCHAKLHVYMGDHFRGDYKTVSPSELVKLACTMGVIDPFNYIEALETGK